MIHESRLVVREADDIGKRLALSFENDVAVARVAPAFLYAVGERHLSEAEHLFYVDKVELVASRNGFQLVCREGRRAEEHRVQALQEMEQAIGNMHNRRVQSLGLLDHLDDVHAIDASKANDTIDVATWLRFDAARNAAAIVLFFFAPFLRSDY